MTRKIAEMVRQISAGERDASQPVAILFGAVQTAAPLSIMVDQRFILEEAFLTKLDHVRGLAEGDAVVLLRAAGGKDYVVLGKVMEDGTT